MLGGFAGSWSGRRGIVITNGHSTSNGSSDVHAHVKAHTRGAGTGGREARILGNAAGVDPSLSRRRLR